MSVFGSRLAVLHIIETIILQRKMQCLIAELLLIVHDPK